jgi:hypothetical protein
MPKEGFGSFWFNPVPWATPPKPAQGSGPKIENNTIPKTMPEPLPRDTSSLAQKEAAGSKITGPVLDFSPNSLLSGIILSEILGKPRCLQKTFIKRW